MMAADDLEDRLARLRAEWPFGSMVDDVMARIGPPEPRRSRLRPRLFAGVAASGLVAALVVWLIILGQPKTLLAAVQDGLKRAKSAHVVTIFWDTAGAPHRSDLWYRRGEGLRTEWDGQVIVEDGKFQWSWRNDKAEGGPEVLRRRTPGFFSIQLLSMFALSEIPGDWKRGRSPELDRMIDGRECQGFTIALPEPDVQGLVLAEEGGLIREITVRRRRDDGTWRSEREIRIDYDVPVPAEKVVLSLPAGARVVDLDEAFDNRYPLDRALHRVELGGLIFAVHDLQPLKDREGFYAVSSVRGTPEFLKAYPPRQRPLNPETVMIDVAFQSGSNRMLGSKYDLIVMGNATREGVEFSWWMVVPRRYFEVKDGKRVDLPDNDQPSLLGEPGRLDDLPGKARLPLSAIYYDKKLRDANGVARSVSTWVEVPVPPDRPPTTIEDVAARARRDLLLMAGGSAWSLLGVAADAKKADPSSLSPQSHFAPGAISDADFAAAVRRGLDELRAMDEVRASSPPAGSIPPGESR